MGAQNKEWIIVLYIHKEFDVHNKSEKHGHQSLLERMQETWWCYMYYQIHNNVALLDCASVFLLAMFKSNKLGQSSRKMSRNG